MKLFTHIVRQHRLHVAALVAALVILAILGIPASRAASVVITNTFMTDQPGPHQVQETIVPSGVSSVYFDYTVDSPSSDTCEVEVYAEGTAGISIATGILACSQAGANFVTLPAPSGTWADGGYCTVLYIDGVPDSLSGHMPLSWAVGTGTPPSCPEPVVTVGATLTPVTGTPVTATPPTATPTSAPTNTPTSTATLTPSPTATTAPLPPVPTTTPTNTATPTATPSPTPRPQPTSVVEEPLKHFVLTIDNPLHANRTGRLRFWVQGTHGKAVSGATVTVDGRKAGIAHILSGHADRSGSVTFSNVHPTRSAILSVRATKIAYTTIQVGLWVQP
jgi:hypothetical protein